jgi:hypothetical protein
MTTPRGGVSAIACALITLFLVASLLALGSGRAH